VNVPLVAAIFVLPRYHVYLWGLLGVGSGLAITIGLVRNRPAHRLAWVFAAMGISTFAAGDITYDVLTKVLHQSNPFPSVADAFYLATPPLLAAALVVMVRARRRSDGDMGALLDALIVGSGCAVLSWVYLIQPYVRATGMTMPAKLTSIAYPLGDIVILLVLARLVFGAGTRNTSVRLLATGALALLAADVAYGWIQLNGSWKVGGPVDVGWVLLYVCWGAAALHPAMGDLTVEQPQRVRHLKPGTLVLLSGATLPAPLLIVWRNAVGTPRDTAIIAGASAALFGLVMLRLTGLAYSHAAYARREQTLHAFSERLVAATGRSDVWDAVVDAVVASTAGGVVSCVVTDARHGRDVIVHASAAEVVGENVNVAQEDNGDRCSVSLDGGGAVAGVPGTTIWTVLELAAPHGGTEKVLLAHERPFTGDLRTILDSIAAELTLALGRVELARVRHDEVTERKFRSMVQHSVDLITLLGPDLRVVYQSPAAIAAVGALAGGSIDHLVHPDDAAGVETQLTKLLAGGPGASVVFECRIAHHDGHWRTFETVITSLLDDPDVGALVLNSRDVSDRRALEHELNRQAFYDTLTGLANRALFLDRLLHAMEIGDRDADPVAVLFLDLDDFKTVNDSLGHPAGDRLLIAVAERLRSATRPGDTVARFGGDEFAVLVESGTMPGAAAVVADRIAEAFRATFHIEDNDVAVRASIGIALGRRAEDKPDDLLRDADLAMYVAKHNGGGRFEMYRSDMHQDAVHRLQMAGDLRRGLDAGQLEVFYQPIVDARTHGLTGVEALVRWHHPTLGLVPPIEFIPIAEATGLIVAVGCQVMRDATRQAEEWRRSGLVDDGFYVSVNVSARQLQDPNLVEDVACALADSGLPSRALVVEMTESILIENLETTLPRLHALKALGLRLAVDDFGTGYSSLSYLADLPVSAIKIDKSFIDRVAQDADGAAMVRSVIDLSHALGLSCTAEGVERRDQLVVLDDLGCDSIQGYLFARPTCGAETALTLGRIRRGEVLEPAVPV